MCKKHTENLATQVFHKGLNHSKTEVDRENGGISYAMKGNFTMFELSNFDNNQPKVEAAFKSLVSLTTTQRGKEQESTSRYRRDLESLYVEEVEQENMEGLFTKGLPRAKEKYKGWLPFKWFNCKKVGHIAVGCPEAAKKEKKK